MTDQELRELARVEIALDKIEPEYGDFLITWHRGKQRDWMIINVPDYVYDADADRDCEMNDDLSPLAVYLREELQAKEGSGAELDGYEPWD